MTLCLRLPVVGSMQRLDRRCNTVVLDPDPYFKLSSGRALAPVMSVRLAMNKIRAKWPDNTADRWLAPDFLFAGDSEEDDEEEQDEQEDEDEDLEDGYSE